MTLAVEARISRTTTRGASPRHLVALVDHRPHPRTGGTTAVPTPAATAIGRRALLHAAPPVPPHARGGARIFRVGREHDVRGQHPATGERTLARAVKGERVEVENEAGASKRLDGEEPRKGDRRECRVSRPKIEAGVNAQGHLGCKKKDETDGYGEEKRKRREPKMRIKAHVPSRTSRKRTGVRPQPRRSETINLKRVRAKRTVSKETKATL